MYSVFPIHMDSDRTKHDIVKQVCYVTPQSAWHSLAIFPVVQCLSLTLGQLPPLADLVQLLLCLGVVHHDIIV